MGAFQIPRFEQITKMEIPGIIGKTSLLINFKSCVYIYTHICLCMCFY